MNKLVRGHITIDTGLAGNTTTAGCNVEALVADLEKRMRDAAADLRFEEAARLRDELKRLRETEMAVAEDSVVRQGSVREKAGAYKGPKAYGDAANLPKTRAAKPGLGSMGPSTDREVPLGAEARKKGGGKPRPRRWKR